jgi:hypothetical protein
MNFMKTFNTLTLALALGLIQPLVSNADDWFRLSWRGTVYTTGANGQVVSKSFSEKDFIQNVATANGLDAKTLAFVYRPGKHDTVVVNVATGTFVADVIQMENLFQQVSNAGQTKIVRQAFLFDEQRGQIGSAFGTETAKYDTSGAFISDSFHGTFQYSIADNDPYSDVPAWLAGVTPP